MTRRHCRPEPSVYRVLVAQQDHCWVCSRPMWVTYHNRRTITTLDGVVGLTLKIRRCLNPDCAQYHKPYRPEGEGTLALPQSEFGLDVLVLIGTLRYREQRSVPEIHQALRTRGVTIAQRTVTNLIQRYEELVALHLTDKVRLRDRFIEQGRVILAIDGLQPDAGHEVLWVLRDCLSGEVLLARSLLSAAEVDLVPLLREVVQALPVPIAGVISDGQHSIRKAVETALPGIPHQLCHFHYLREAARPIYEADRHAKKELKKLVRGVRPIERTLETDGTAESEVVRGYCLAVRSALTDDGRPPLDAPGLRLNERLGAVHASIQRVASKRGSLPDSHVSTRS